MMKQWLWCIPMLLLISPVVSAGEAKSMEELGLIEEPEKPVKVKPKPQAPKPKPQPPKVVVKTVTVEDPQTRQALAQAEAEIERLKRKLNQQNAQPKHAASLTPDQQLMAQGMWRDPKTNMIWMRCSLGQTWNGSTCTGEASEHEWQAAKDAVAAMNRNGGYGGYTDWVVPHIEDLASLIRCNTGFGSRHEIPAKRGGETTIQEYCKDGYQRPTIDQAIFPNTPDSWYWSASPYAGYVNGAWGVIFNYGATSNDVKNNHYYVRAVRAGQ